MYCKTCFRGRRIWVTSILPWCTLRSVLMSLFFFKQKTAYEMRISDWSSDVCSSDLYHGDLAVAAVHELFRSQCFHHLDFGGQALRIEQHVFWPHAHGDAAAADLGGHLLRRNIQRCAFGGLQHAVVGYRDRHQVHRWRADELGRAHV